MSMSIRKFACETMKHIADIKKTEKLQNFQY